MSNHDQQFDYLDEHLPYMVATMRYGFEKISQPQHFRDWNAYFESFAVNARNLAAFLDNSDTGNFRASDFISGFRIRKGDIQGPLAKLRNQVFHLGKSRPRDVEKKLDLAHVRLVNDWIEAGLKEFVTGLPPECRKHWNEQKADPKFDSPLSSRKSSAILGQLPLASSAGEQTFLSTSSSPEFRVINWKRDPA